MKVIIAGSRDIFDYSIVEYAINNSGFKEDISEIVSGNAKGIDSLGEIYANKYSMKLTIFEAEWDKYGKSAGPIRNRKMAEYADTLIAITNGSKGTANMINIMKELNKMFYVYNYTFEDEFCYLLREALKKI